MLVDIEKLGKAGSGAPGSGGVWTPDRIMEIIKGIKELVAVGQQIRAGTFPGNGDQGTRAIAPQGDAVTMPQVKSFAQQLLDNLIGQGFGDQSIMTVLEKTPFTINQIRQLIK